MAQQPPISDTPTDITTEAIVNFQDGRPCYRQLHFFSQANRDQQTMVYAALEKQQQFIDKEMANQGKSPEIIMSAVLKATGIADVNVDSFTFDTFQKIKQNWDKLGDDILKDAEKNLKGKGKP